MKVPDCWCTSTPGDTVTSREVPKLGEESVGFRNDFKVVEGQDPGRSNIVAWRRRRVVWVVAAVGTPETSDAAIPMALDRPWYTMPAWRRSRRSRRSPRPGRPRCPTRRHGSTLYQGLNDRLLGGYPFVEPSDTVGTSAIPNAMLLLDSRHVAGALADATALLRARLVDQEKHIVGISRDLRATEASSTPPGSRFPNAAFGYHLYADAEGAAEALRADVDEMRLRLSEEVAVGQAHELRLVEAQTDQRGDGPLRRAFHGGFTATAAGDLTEDVPVDLLSTVAARQRRAVRRHAGQVGGRRGCPGPADRRPA